MEKQIKITGINNRYYIKKLTKEKKVEIRVNSKKWEIDKELLSWENQIICLDKENYLIIKKLHKENSENLINRNLIQDLVFNNIKGNVDS